MKLKVALLAGGDSSEREIALKSAAMVEAAFNREKYDVMLIDIYGREWSHTDSDGTKWLLDRNDFSITVNGCRTVFDYAFIMIHGSPGEDGKIQGYLDMMKVPYSSSELVSTVVTFDKQLAKRTVRGIKGLNLAKEIVIARGDSADVNGISEKLGMPVFVKPNASGSSFGVSKVKRVEEIEAAVNMAWDEGGSALVEEFIGGREFGVGVVVTEQKEYVFPVAEIISKNEFFDFEAKYTEGRSEEIVPADIPEGLSARLQALGLEVYKACGCRGVARADFIVTPSGDIYMIEINSIPGMSPGSIVPKQIVACGMTMTELIDIIIEDTRCSR